MAQGLNFQTHQYVDPSEQLQKSLGAGGMFAQTLKGMQQFDQDEAKLQMMRQDRDRQAKLDAEHTEDRAAVKKTLEEENALKDAMYGKATNYDATSSFEQLEKQGGKKFTDALYKGDVKADDMQVKLGNTIVDQYMYNQTYAPSELERVDKFITEKGGIGSVGGSIKDAYGKAQANAVAAKAAISEKRDLLSSKKADYETAGRKDEFDKQMKLFDMQMRANDSDAVAASRAERSGSEGTAGKDKFDSQYGNVGSNIMNNPMVRNMSGPMKTEIATTLKQFQDRNVNPAIASAAILNKIEGTGDKTDAGVYTEYKFSRPHVEDITGMTPAERLAYDGGKEGRDSSVYEANRVTRNKLFGDYQKAVASGVGENDAQLQDISSKIAKLDRTQGQIYHDEAHDTWKKFLTDNMEGYKDPDAALEAGKKPLNAIIPGTEKTTKTVETKAVGVPGFSAKIKAFQLPNNYTALSSDRKAQDAMLSQASLSLIKNDEGNGKNGKRYEPYADKVKQEDGSTRNAGMVMGHGVKVSEFQDQALGGKKYDPTNAKHREIFDKYEEKRLLDLVPLARKQAAALGLPAEAIPVLASMDHQLGKGWMSDFKGSVQNIKDGQYDVAIQRIRDSKWNRVQTPERAQKFIDMLGAVKEMKEGGSNWFATHAPKSEYDSSLTAKAPPAKVDILQSRIASSAPVQQSYVPLKVVENDQAPLDTGIRNIMPRINNAVTAHQNNVAQATYENGIDIAKNAKAHLANIEKEKASRLDSVLTKTGYDAAYKNATPAEKLRIQADALRKYSEMQNAAALQNLVNNRY
jgi:hypothetical protein